jgi:SAM-dependent methyltransferase
MTTEPVRAGSDWLALREPADAAARAPVLAEALRRHLPDGGTEIHDLGCGTGSMARWLAARLDGPQHWVLYDRDDELLALASADPPSGAADGAVVGVETRRRDITRLDAGDLAGATLITASALLDMMTADELHRLVETCVRAGCPVLITLSVIGRVDLAPADSLDRCVMEAFNAHQRRTTGGGRLLGPDAAGAAVGAFTRLGHHVVVRPSLWRLGPDRSELAAEWFTGWLAAACEQRPELGEAAHAYAWRRLTQATAGALSVTVHHRDLLAVPGRAAGNALNELRRSRHDDA